MISQLSSQVIVLTRWLGRKPYTEIWQAMRDFTDNRTEETSDEIWFLEHEPVFTLGQNSKPEHLLLHKSLDQPTDGFPQQKNIFGQIPIIQSDRGGQVTYHGPGQLMVYILLDLKRKKFTVRDLVSSLERSVVDFLVAQHIPAAAKPEAPGIYVQDDKKICSIGLRIRRGSSYHGIALNVAMDLLPFEFINPCGFSNLKMAQLSDFLPLNTRAASIALLKQIATQLSNFLMKNLGYTSATYFDDWNQIDGT